MKNYSQRRITKKWGELFPKITSTQQFLEIKSGNTSLKLEIPKKQSLTNTRNISYK